MKIKLSDHFSYRRLLRFAFPSIMMMIFTSVYNIVDGLFVSNFVGTIPFAAINLIMPILMIIGGFGFMMGAGGTAIVSKTLGEGDKNLANRYFSLFVYFTAAAGVLLAILGVIFLRPIATLMGAKDELLECCVSYGSIVILAMPAFMLQNLFQSFFIVAEKPKRGLFVTLLAGVTNIILDALFVAVLDMGLEGAALATSISQCIGGILPIFYFSGKKSGLISLSRTSFYGKALLRAMTNGSSELMSNIASSVTTILFNFQLMRFEGEKGIAAYGVIMYLSFTFAAVFIGYAVSTAPIIGFHYGADNRDELGNLLKKSTKITVTLGIIMSAFAFTFADTLASIFVGYDASLMEMTVKGLRIFSLSFIFSGFSIFSSSFFTALNNGPISAFISFMRTLVYQALGVIILPLFFEIKGVWHSMLLSEILAVVTTIVCIFALKDRYGYLKPSNKQQSKVAV